MFAANVILDDMSNQTLCAPRVTNFSRERAGRSIKQATRCKLYRLRVMYVAPPVPFPPLPMEGVHEIIRKRNRVRIVIIISVNRSNRGQPRVNGRGRREVQPSFPVIHCRSSFFRLHEDVIVHVDIFEMYFRR
jgi:hypothetical protein